MNPEVAKGLLVFIGDMKGLKCLRFAWPRTRTSPEVTVSKARGSGRAMDLGLSCVNSHPFLLPSVLGDRDLRALQLHPLHQLQYPHWNQ